MQGTPGSSFHFQIMTKFPPYSMPWKKNLFIILFSDHRDTQVPFYIKCLLVFRNRSTCIFTIFPNVNYCVPLVYDFCSWPIIRGFAFCWRVQFSFINLFRMIRWSRWGKWLLWNKTTFISFIIVIENGILLEIICRQFIQFCGLLKKWSKKPSWIFEHVFI